VDASKNATGQETKLDAAELRALSGNLTLNKLYIANPKGFSSGGVVNLGSCSVTVDTGSLMSDKIVVKEIVLTGLAISIEQKDIKNNLLEIINYIQAQRGKPTAGEAAPQEAPPANASSGKGKDLDITVIRIVKPTIAIDLMGMKETYNLDDIVIEHPLNEDGRLPKLIDIMGKILLQMADQSLHNPKIPANIQKLLDSNLGKLDKIIKLDKLKDVTKIGGQLQDVVGDLQKGLTKPDDLLKGLQGLKNPLDDNKKK
jgi:hypothetical protein